MVRDDVPVAEEQHPQLAVAAVPAFPDGAALSSRQVCHQIVRLTALIPGAVAPPPDGRIARARVVLCTDVQAEQCNFHGQGECVRLEARANSTRMDHPLCQCGPLKSNLQEVVRLLAVVAGLLGLGLRLYGSARRRRRDLRRPHEHQQAAAGQDRRQEQVHARRHAPDGRATAIGRRHTRR